MTVTIGTNGLSKLLLSRYEAAEQLGLCTRSLDWLIETGKVAIIRIGRRVLIPAGKLQEFASRGDSERIRPE